MHLRFLPRVHILASLAFVSLLVYSIYVYPSLKVASRITKAWSGARRKVVVFGDDFSDTGLYSGEALPINLRTVRLPEEGRRWTEVLCSELVCDSVLNFASSDSQQTTYSGGVVLDNDLYTNTTTSRNETSSLPDLKEQVKQWIRYLDDSDHDTVDEEIVVTITLGFWDIWQYATLDYERAQDAVARSVYVLFEQLNEIAAACVKPPQIIIPKLWDVTWSPRFMSLAIEPKTAAWRYAEEQHKIVLLTDYWNTVLEISARDWQGGYLYLPDWNTWLLAQIRLRQMRKSGIFDALGVGKGKSRFQDVSTPCVSSLVSAEGELHAIVPHCERPKDHLFWDDTQFSATAHKILGQEAAKLLHANETANVVVSLKPSATEGKSGSELVKIHMVPSLAPGN